MKKIFAVIVFALATVNVCNAQFFVGGELGVWGSTRKTKTTAGGVTTDVKQPSSFELQVGPKFGYFFNDKWSIGLTLLYNFEQQTTHGATKVKTIEHNFGGSPYVRWAFAKAKKFSFIAEGTVDIWGGIGYTNPSNNTKTRSLTVGVSIAPVITYDLGEHFVLETRLDFLSLGYAHRRSKTITTIAGVETSAVDVRNNFEFSVDYDNILTTGAITIGMIYKF
jgi:hypothetical protein